MNKWTRLKGSAPIWLKHIPGFVFETNASHPKDGYPNTTHMVIGNIKILADPKGNNLPDVWQRISLLKEKEALCGMHISHNGTFSLDDLSSKQFWEGFARPIGFGIVNEFRKMWSY